METFKSQYEAIKETAPDSKVGKVQNLWLHLMSLYFPREKGFGLMFQDWPVDGSLDLSILYLAPVKTDTRDLRHQPKNMFIMTSENPIHEEDPESLKDILKKLPKKLRKLIISGQDKSILCIAVAAGTHVRFFWLLPGKNELVEGDFGFYLELMENERLVNIVLSEFNRDFVGEWGLVDQVGK